eukprot:6241578-Amphidinium_carterae.1
MPVPEQLARSDVRVQLAALSHQVEFCMKMCRRTLTSSPGPSVPVTGPADQLAELKQMCQHQSAKIRQMDELQRMHTTAISRTWQWTSSIVQSLSIAPWMRSVGSNSAATTSPCRQATAPAAAHPTVELDRGAVNYVVHDKEKTPEEVHMPDPGSCLARSLPQGTSASVNGEVSEQHATAERVLQDEPAGEAGRVDPDALAESLEVPVVELSDSEVEAE